MQRNQKALLIYFSIVGIFLVILLMIAWANIGKFDIKFFYKVYTDKSQKQIKI